MIAAWECAGYASDQLTSTVGFSSVRPIVIFGWDHDF